ncbi:MAG: hypothetical protein IKD72_06095 [Clostridia bacterium]|nr:hypothetical protein [Clostridia bacterium]
MNTFVGVICVKTSFLRSLFAIHIPADTANAVQKMIKDIFSLKYISSPLQPNDRPPFPCPQKLYHIVTDDINIPKMFFTKKTILRPDHGCEPDQ